MGKVPFVLALLLAVTGALAQESPSYKLTEHTFNAGGHPSGGIVLTSASYKISLDAVGDSVVSRVLSSTSYHMDGGFISGYPPPGEVMGLNFTDVETLVWSPERSAGVYNFYRDLMSSLVSLGYGTCAQQDLIAATTTDNDPVPDGDGYFYLVTVENRLGEEGTKGLDSSDTVREGNVCP